VFVPPFESLEKKSLLGGGGTYKTSCHEAEKKGTKATGESDVTTELQIFMDPKNVEGVGLVLRERGKEPTQSQTNF